MACLCADGYCPREGVITAKTSTMPRFTRGLINPCLFCTRCQEWKCDRFGKSNDDWCTCGNALMMHGYCGQRHEVKTVD